jgi:hypothetical protein
VSWTSSANTIAQVSDAPTTKGLVTALGVGSNVTTATLSGIQGSSSLTVTPPTLTSLIVTPANPTLDNHGKLPMTATGSFSDGSAEDLTREVNWTSSNSSVARILSGIPSLNGLLFSVGPGTAAITATLESVIGSTLVTVTSPSLISIAVTPASPSIAKGTTVQLSATCNFSDGSNEDCTTEVSWTSTSNKIAQVSNVSGSEGVVAGLQVGSTSIIATFEGVQGSTEVTVTSPVLTSLLVTPANPTVPDSQTLQMMATAVFSDGTTENVTSEVDWTSSNENVAHITSSSSPKTNGRLMAKNPGVTTITAELEDIEGSTLVTVK